MALLALVVACGGGGDAAGPPTPPPAATVASIVLSLAATSVIVGENTIATAETRDASGGVLTGRAVVFASSNTSVATVTASGNVSAIAIGSANISATSEGRTASAVITVQVAPVATVGVTLPITTLTVGQTTVAAAETRDAKNVVLVGRPVTWSSSNETVAAVSTSGRVAAVAPGTASIVATSEGRSGSAIVTVLVAPVASVAMSVDSIDIPIRTNRALVATPRDAAGQALPNRTVTWVSSSPAIATVSATGLVIMYRPGTVTITATSEGRSGSTRVRGSVANLSAIVDSVRLAMGMPAMGAVMVSSEGMIAIGVGGSRRISGGLPVTVNDKWHIGSNTKAITGMLAGILVDGGVLRWDRTVDQAFPDLLPTMRAEYRAVTLKDLLSHAGGLQNTLVGLTATTNLAAGRTAWASVTFGQAPIGPRGMYYYSNNSFGAAGAMIERAGSSSYEHLMNTRLLQPLGVIDAGWGPTTGVGGMDQPVGHQRVGSTWQVCEACDNLAPLSSAGTMHLPLAGWAKIIQELLLADQGRGTLLTQATARVLSTNALPVGGGNPAYGMGWTVFGASGARGVSHDGSNTLNYSRAVVFLDTNIAFLAVTNAADNTGLAENAHAALYARLNTYWSTGR